MLEYYFPQSGVTKQRLLSMNRVPIQFVASSVFFVFRYDLMEKYLALMILTPLLQVNTGSLFKIKTDMQFTPKFVHNKYPGPQDQKIR